jgi:hypothetical protein
MSILPDSSFSGPDAPVWATANNVVAFSGQFADLTWTNIGGSGAYSSGLISVIGMTTDAHIAATVIRGLTSDLLSCQLIGVTVGYDSVLFILNGTPNDPGEFTISLIVASY